MDDAPAKAPPPSAEGAIQEPTETGIFIAGVASTGVDRALDSSGGRLSDPVGNEEGTVGRVDLAASGIGANGGGC